MTAQEVIKKFMSALNTQNYTSSTDALDDAVKAGSRYSGIQDLIDNFLGDQRAVERAAIKTVLGSNYKKDYDGLQLSELEEMAETDTELAAALSETARYSETPSNYHNEDFTAAERIRIVTAETFLKDYCGIELERYIFPYNGSVTYWTRVTTNNTDTGAITGSDAGGSTVKDSDTVVPEIGNKYTAKGSAKQIINTGTNDWIVKATSGNDTINSGGADSIDAGAGADVISVEGNNATISTGANDSAADIVNIAAAVKNFTIENFEQFDKLNIEGNFILASATLTDDIVTVNDATGKRTFTIEGWKNAQNSYVTVNGKTLKLGKWLSDFVDFTEIENAEATTATDTSTAVTVNLDDVTNTSGSFAPSGNSATFSTLTSGAVGTVSSEAPQITTFTTHGLTVELWGQATNSNPTKNGGLTTLTYDKMSTAQKTIWNGIYKWWIKEGLKLNEESYNLGFKTDGVTGTNIKVFFYTNASSFTLAAVTNYGSGKDLELGINMAHFENISSSNVNGSTAITQDGLSSTYNLDRTLAHELNHAVLAANINNFNSLPQFFKEGIAELVHGIDDERVTRIWELASGDTLIFDDGSTVDRLEYSLDLYDTNTGYGDSYASGYMILRYFAKHAAEQTSSLPAFGDDTVRVNLTGEDATYYARLTSKNETATTTATNYSIGAAENHNYELSPGIRQQIYTNNDAWTFSGITSNNSVIAGAGADSATITGEYNVVSLGGGNDSVLISGNNNTITGGAGADIYTLDYDLQSLTINDFDVANDSITLKTSVTSAGYVDNSIILGDTTIYLNDAENISDFYNMSIRNGRTSTTLGDMLGVETFDWSAGNYYVVIEDNELNISNGVAAFSKIPSEEYAKVVIDRNKNITLGNVDDDLEITLTPPDSNSHTLKIGDYSCQFTGAASFIGNYATSGTFTVSENFYFYDNTAKTLTHSGNGNVIVSLNNNLTISGLTNGAAVSITDGTETETYSASGNIITREIITADATSEEIYTDEGEYTSGNLLTATFDTEINHYVNDYSNNVILLYSGTLEISDYIFAIVNSDDGIILQYDSSGENLVGIDNFDEGESISINGKTYTLTRGNIIREDDDKVYSGNFDEFISNFTNEDFWQVIKNVNDTVISGEMVLEGTEAADAFTISKVTIAAEGSLALDAKDGNDTISVSEVDVKGYLDIIGGDGNDSIYIEKMTTSKSVNIGVGDYSGNDTISVKDSTVTGGGVYVSSGDEGSDYSISVDNVSVGAEGAFYINDDMGGGGNDTISVSNIKASGDFMVRNYDGNSKISISNVEFSGLSFFVDGGSGDDSVSISDVTVKSGSFYVYSDYGSKSKISVENVSVNGGGYFDIITGADNDLISVKDVDEIRIDSGNGTDTLVFGGAVTATISDFSSTDIISLSSAVTAADFEDGVLTLGDIKLKLSGIEDISDYESMTVYEGRTKTTLGELLTPSIWKVSDGVATFGKLITVSGLSANATVDDISLSGTTVRISANALAQNTVTISDGYKLALGSDVTKPETGAATLTVSSGTATYTAGITSAGYVLSDNQIIYQSEIAGETLTEISGLSENATVDDISLKNKTVTISANALAQNNVTITNGYKLALASDVAKPTAGAASWTVSSGTATYNSGNTSEGYKLLNNQIIYQSETAGTDLITISGLSENATVDDISLKNKTVTISANALAQDTVTISAGYTLALAKDVITSTTTDAGWTVSKGTATYSTGFQTAGYILSKNTISYISATAAQTLVTVSGLKTSATAKQLSLSGNTVTVAQAATNRGELKISEGYALNMAKGAYSKVSVVGGADVDTISNAGNTLVISTGAGNDLISLASGTSNNTLIGGAGNDSISATKGKNLYQYASGDGDDTISGWTANDSLKITSGAIDSWSISGSDVIFKVVSGSITIKDGAGVAINTIASDAKKAETYIYGENVKYDAKKTSAFLASNYGGSYSETLKTVATIDGSAATTALNISGNDKANAIIGGSGADTLNGGKGNDTLTGGSGADVFVYSAGKDVIADYTAGEDKISIGANFAASVVKKDVVLKVNKDTLTIKNSAGQKITVDDSVYIYETGKTYSENKDAATLTAAFKGKIDDGVISIQGADATSSILGNSSNNVISGGSKADSLNGGAGNDTLKGGAGKDVFVFSGGDDLITDYTAGDDKISIGADFTASVSGGNVIFTTADGSITVADGVGKKITTVDAKKKTATKIYYDGYSLNDKQTAVEFYASYGGSYSETLKNVATIDGSAATTALNISGNDKPNAIKGGSGADTLNGGKGNDTLTGGAGADVFVYSAGKDVIADYTTGEDKISIGAAISSVTATKKDVTFKIGKDTLIVKNSAGQKITVDDTVYIYETGKIYSENKDAVTLTAAFKGTIESGVVTVDGSNLSAVVKLTGNDSDNIIYGGKSADSLNGGAGDDFISGGKGNDTLFGGEGNDTLTGGDGNDLFIYESGNDLITDYAASKDKIKISSEFTWGVSGDNVIFTTDAGTLTVQNGAGKNITTVDSKNKATTQKYSATSAKTLDLFEDNNFITDEAQLSEITASKVSVTQIQDTKDELTQPQTLLTFAKK